VALFISPLISGPVLGAIAVAALLIDRLRFTGDRAMVERPSPTTATS
jgi:hypothetical protein